MDNRKGLVFAILDFLKQSAQDGTIKPADIESVEVAIQCLGEAFDVDTTSPEQVKKYSITPKTLLDIFEVFVKTQKKVAGMKEGNSNRSEENNAKAEELKGQGNKKVVEKEFQDAILLYDQAIELDGSNAVYYANRAAAYSLKGDHEKAVEDAKKAAEIDSGYSKAYSRLGHACFSLGRYQESIDAYVRGLEIDPGNPTMTEALSTAKARLSEPRQTTDSIVDTSERSAGGGGVAGGLADMFGGGAGGMPDISSMLQNPAMMRIAQQAMQNPEMMRMAREMISGGGGGLGEHGGKPIGWSGM